MSETALFFVALSVGILTGILIMWRIRVYRETMKEIADLDRRYKKAKEELNQ